MAKQNSEKPKVDYLKRLTLKILIQMNRKEEMKGPTLERVQVKTGHFLVPFTSFFVDLREVLHHSRFVPPREPLSMGFCNTVTVNNASVRREMHLFF